jgi:DnaA family protein
MRQLALGVQLRAAAVFASFAPGPNAELVAALRNPGPAAIWLWGAHGAGKTHLLQAVCAANGAAAAYFPLVASGGPPPEALVGFESARILCIDDADTAAGDLRWEHALFRVFNAAADLQTRLIFAAGAAPRALPWQLEDWRSRAAACVVYQLRELDDAARIEALQLRAGQRGLQLPAETAEYLLRRLPRDLPTLLALLDDLDVASLAAQRRLTVPFIRDALERRAETPPSNRTTQTPGSG